MRLHVDRVGLCFLDRPSVAEQVRLTRRADRLGFESVWVCETRLVRDAISVLGAMAATTNRIRLATGVINVWTRVPALTALTLATLDEYAPGRTILGIGAYWDPLAWKQGIERRKPLRAMREWVHIVRELLALKRITYEGDIFHVRDLALDLGFGVRKRPRAVPIYIGATGTAMLELSGEIADGVLLNAFTSVPYIRRAVAAIERGTRRGKQSFRKFDRPQLVSLAMSKDGAKARDAARYLVTLYLGQQPHIAQASGVKADLLKEINRELGGWPPRKGGPKRAMQLVDDRLVDFLTAAGTADECRQKVRDYQAAGACYPVLLPITFNYDEMIDAFTPT